MTEGEDLIVSDAVFQGAITAVHWAMSYIMCWKPFFIWCVRNDFSADETAGAGPKLLDPCTYCTSWAVYSHSVQSLHQKRNKSVTNSWNEQTHHWIVFWYSHSRRIHTQCRDRSWRILFFSAPGSVIHLPSKWLCDRVCVVQYLRRHPGTNNPL